jgi:predicted Zn-dependent protease
MGHTEAAKPGSSFRPTGRGLLRRRVWVLAAAGLIALVAGGWFGWRLVRAAHLREHALRLSGQGDFAAAEPFLRRAFEQDGRDAEVVRALALGYLRADQARNAEVYLNRWCDVQPDRVEPHERRLELFLGMKHNDQAVAEARRLLQLKPDHRRAQQLLAMLLVQQGRHAEAEGVCRRFLQGAPGEAVLLYYLAESCHGRGNDREAETILDSLLRDQPRYHPALVLRAILYREAEQDEQAIPLLRQALALAPANRLAGSHLIQALARTGRAEEARRERDQMLRRVRAERALMDFRVQPDNLELGVKAGEALLEVGRPEEGLRLLEEVLARAPGNEAALRLRAAHQGARAPGAPKR